MCKRKRSQQSAAIADQWAEAIKHIMHSGTIETAICKTTAAIVDVVRAFSDLPNIAFWYTFGSRHLTGIRLSNEVDCVEILTLGHVPSIIRPAELTLHYIREDPSESFLLLEFDELKPISATDAGKAFDVYGAVWEELREVAPEEYVDIDYQIEDTSNSRLGRTVTRWFRGQVVIASTTSILAKGSLSDDGRYGSMDVSEIKAKIRQGYLQDG